MGSAIDLTNQRFGRLLVLGRGAGLYGRPSWVCRCDCGHEVEVGRGNLRSGSITSCGCYRNECLSAKKRTHGLSHTSAYSSWAKMMQRCYDSRHPYFTAYGGAGVEVCQEWHRFEQFYEDMGERPEGTTLDRKEGSKGYYKDNCRWATRKEQANNTKGNHLIRYRGKEYTLSALAERFGLQSATLRKRLARMSTRQAVLLPRYGRV